jgi:hypothetical protein
MVNCYTIIMSELSVCVCLCCVCGWLIRNYSKKIVINLNFNSSHATFDAEFCGRHNEFVTTFVAEFRKLHISLFLVANRSSKSRIAISRYHYCFLEIRWLNGTHHYNFCSLQFQMLTHWHGWWRGPYSSVIHRAIL